MSIIYILHYEFGKATVMILEKLNLIEAIKSHDVVGGSELPWRKSLHPERSKESIRPIFGNIESILTFQEQQLGMNFLMVDGVTQDLRLLVILICVLVNY